MHPLGTVESPPSSLAWIGSFRIPEKCSIATMKVLSEEIITDKTQVEIVACSYCPASIPSLNISDIRRVHHNVYKTNPFLKDKAGNGIASSSATDA